MQQSTGNKGDCPAEQGEGGAVPPPPPEILAAGTEPEDSSPYAGRLSFVSLGAVLKDLSHVHVAGINDNGIVRGEPFVNGFCKCPFPKPRNPFFLLVQRTEDGGCPVEPAIILSVDCV